MQFFSAYQLDLHNEAKTIFPLLHFSAKVNKHLQWHQGYQPHKCACFTMFLIELGIFTFL